MFKHILVGFDGSSASRAALDLAGTLAARLGSRLTVISVIEELPPYVAARGEEARAASEAREYFTELQRPALQRLRRRGIDAAFEIRTGNEGRTILEAVRESGADLLAVGHAGHSGAWGGSLGSTAARLAEAAPCAVLVARSGAPAAVGRILTGVDGSAPARHALELAGALAAGMGARLVIGVAADLADGAERRQALGALEGQLARGASPAIATVHGDPARGLLSLAREADCQLVVLGSTGRRHPWAGGLGPTAAHVLDRADIPVLVVRPPNVTAAVAAIMRPQVHVGHPETTVREAAGLLLRTGIKSLPIVDGNGGVVGIVTLGDLLRRASVGVRPEVAAVLPPQDVRRYLDGLERGSLTCAEIMTTDVATIGPQATLPDVLQVLTRRGVKRLPVVDGEGRLCGIISRADVLRALAGAPDRGSVAVPSPSGGRTARDVMDSVVLTVRSDTPIEEAAAAVLTSGIGRVAVVDGGDRVVGVLATRDLLPLAAPDSRAQVLETLSSAPGPHHALGLALGHDARQRVAGDLMRRDVVTVPPEADLDGVLRLMMARGLKRLLVVDEARRVVGAVDRAGVLRAITAALVEQ